MFTNKAAIFSYTSVHPSVCLDDLKRYD